jgi:hypothetical protein
VAKLPKRRIADAILTSNYSHRRPGGAAAGTMLSLGRGQFLILSF